MYGGVRPLHPLSLSVLHFVDPLLTLSLSSVPLVRGAFIPAAASADLDPSGGDGFYRFTNAEVDHLVLALGMPSELHSPGLVRCSSRDALCALLLRLSYPRRLADMSEFGSKSRVSLMYRMAVDWIDDNLAQLLARLPVNFLAANNAALLGEALFLVGCPSHNIIGFIDGTFREVCRPIDTRYNDVQQRQYYSGKESAHGVNFMSVFFPNGLSWLAGPMVGSAHDVTVLRQTGWLEALEETPALSRFFLYGDSGFVGVSPKIVTPIHSTEQVELNNLMSSLRSEVEHSFGRVQNAFQFHGTNLGSSCS